jgi:hypothetical protein
MKGDREIRRIEVRREREGNRVETTFYADGERHARTADDDKALNDLVKYLNEQVDAAPS